MALNLRKYETQARLSLALGAIALLAALAGAYLVISRFDWQLFWISYNPRGMRALAIYGTILAALGLAAVGFGIGFNSAGQKKNSESRLSWIGFFVNAAVIALALMVGVFFVLTGNPVQV